MPDFSKLTLWPIVLATSFSFLLTPLAIKIAKKIGIVDDPKIKKHPKVIHTYPVPRGGIMPIFASIIICILIFLPLDKHIAGIIIGALIILAMGILDDKYNLNPYLRILIGCFAASFPILAGIGISFINNPLAGGILDLSNPLLANTFTLLWIVFMMNMLNIGAKGVDGQLTGVVAIAALTIALLSLRFSADITEWPVTILATIVTGAYLGFLPWHIYPQKIMPSYGGATLAGYFLAVLSILSTTKVGTLTVVLGVPLIDTGYTIIRRILSGKSPVWGDTGHLHHRLLVEGLTKRQVAYLYWLFSAGLGVLSLYLNSRFKLYTIIGTALFVGGLTLLLTYRNKNRVPRE